jgi:hypothetical protein
MHSDCFQEFSLRSSSFIAVFLSVEVKRCLDSRMTQDSLHRLQFDLRFAHLPVAMRVTEVVKSEPLTILNLDSGCLRGRPEMISNKYGRRKLWPPNIGFSKLDNVAEKARETGGIGGSVGCGSFDQRSNHVPSRSWPVCVSKDIEVRTSVLRCSKDARVTLCPTLSETNVYSIKPASFLPHSYLIHCGRMTAPHEGKETSYDSHW